MQKRRNDRRNQNQPGPAPARNVPAPRYNTVPVPSLNLSEQQARSVAHVKAVLARIEPPVPGVKVKLARPAAAMSLHQTSRSERVRKNLFGDAPARVVNERGKVITDSAKTLGAVNMIKRVVSNMREEDRINHHVRNEQARVSNRLTAENNLTLEQHGVTKPSDRRKNHACLSEHRPDPTPKGGGGTGRAFVQWCKKGD